MEELKINMQKYNMKKLMLSTTLGMFYYSINNASVDVNLETTNVENTSQQSQQPQQVENSCCGCCGKKGKETKNEEESQSGGEDNTKKVDTNQEEQGNVS